MPINRRRNGQFAPDLSGKKNVPTAAPIVPSSNAPSDYDLRAGGRKGAELRTKTFLSNLLGISPEKIDTSGRQSPFSLRANWYFNGVISIGDDKVQLRTKMFNTTDSLPVFMEVTVHVPGRNGRKLTDNEIAALKKKHAG
jgi:hypothetical protein